jgi:PadR family transcriptional regulator PadR
MMAAQRLTVATRRVLLVFLSQPMESLYGSEVSRLSGVSSGRTYSILARLEGLGWLASVWEYVDPRSARRPARRYYGLTLWGESQAGEMLGREVLAVRIGRPVVLVARRSTPLPSCSWLIESAVRRLPPDAADRYRREFLTELLYLAGGERVFYALSVRLRAAAINSALTSVDEIELGRLTDERHKPPLGCRVRLWHRWVMEHEPGVTFEACRDCGRLAGRTIFDPVIP